MVKLKVNKMLFMTLFSPFDERFKLLNVDLAYEPSIVTLVG